MMNNDLKQDENEDDQPLLSTSGMFCQGTGMTLSYRDLYVNP